MFAHRLNDNTELRLLEPRHAEELYALVDGNREHLGQWLPWVDGCRSVEDRREFIKQNLLAFAEKGSMLSGLWHEGQLAGVVGQQPVHPVRRSASLFYFLGEAFQGKGLATTACRAIVNHAIRTLGAHRMEIYLETDNTRSRAVAERLGFQHEGRQRDAYRVNDRFVDLEVYALLEDEWQDTGERLAFSHPLTDNAELRLLLPQDAEALFALVDANREHLRPWLDWVDGTTGVAHIRGFIQRALNAMAKEQGLKLGIWHRGEIAGVVGTLPINWPARKVEIVYWLGEGFQGKGLMTAACRTLLAHLFETLNLNRVEIQLRAENARSRGVAQRLGATLEGIQRQAEWHDGTPGDMECYALLKEEWER